jgi:FMN phosphatase YigB (HAD superfamily)
MFVADGAFGELDAAKALGMLAVKVEQPNQSGDFGTSTSFDHTVERLDQVLALLAE